MDDTGAGDGAAQVAGPRSVRARLRRFGLLAAGVGLTVWAALHASSVGASWSSAWHLIVHLRWPWLAGCGAVWFLGLCVYTVVLTASMPGLSHRRALTLNLSGSAVANVLPLGGIAGTALNLGMVRGWGHTGSDFARFVVVSKTADLVAKLVMPLVAVAGLLVWDIVAPDRRSALWLSGALAAAGAGTLLVTALAGRPGPLLRLLSLVERAWRWCRGRLGRDAVSAWTATATRLMDGTGRLVRRRWAELSWGMALYWLLQGVLLWLCLSAVGLHLPVPVVFAGLVAERSLTLLAITPGGTGPVEAGTIALLIGLGADPTGALAGVLLYRGFVFLAEIPVGGLAIAAWLIGRTRRDRQSPAQAQVRNVPR